MLGCICCGLLCSIWLGSHAGPASAGDLLLQNKEHAELLQSYDERQDAAVKFIQAVRPGLRVQTAALRDPKVHAMPWPSLMPTWQWPTVNGVAHKCDFCMHFVCWSQLHC